MLLVAGYIKIFFDILYMQYILLDYVIYFITSQNLYILHKTKIIKNTNMNIFIPNFIITTPTN